MAIKILFIKNIKLSYAPILIIIILLLILNVIYITSMHLLHPTNLFSFGTKLIFLTYAIVAGIMLICIPTHVWYISIATIQPRDIIPCLLATTFILYSFHGIVLVTLDRSISMYLLSRLNATHLTNGYTIREIKNNFMQGYIRSYTTICRRLMEQIDMGNIDYHQVKYQLTNKGKLLLKIINQLANVYHVNHYYVNQSNNLHVKMTISTNKITQCMTNDIGK